MKQLAQGLVILDLRDGPAQESAQWMPFADFCLVRDMADRILLESHGCEPERVYVISSHEIFLNLVDQACGDTLPPASVEKVGESMTESSPAPDPSRMAPSQRIFTLSARLKAAERQADVMLRDYRVRSKVPLLGPLVAWIRRNLTAHLREPYLDPTLERQVALNRELITILHEMLRLQADQEARLTQLHEERDRD